MSACLPRAEDTLWDTLLNEKAINDAAETFNTFDLSGFVSASEPPPQKKTRILTWCEQSRIAECSMPGCKNDGVTACQDVKCQGKMCREHSHNVSFVKDTRKFSTTICAETEKIMASLLESNPKLLKTVLNTLCDHAVVAPTCDPLAIPA